jgi:hypothetical protein
LLAFLLDSFLCEYSRSLVVAARARTWNFCYHSGTAVVEEKKKAEKKAKRFDEENLKIEHNLEDMIRR